MELVRRVHLMREISREIRSRGRKISLVPTMGALHEGHLALIRKARQLGDVVVVSIFVNPKQFGPAEDYDTYPRDLVRDADLCIEEGVDFLFCPEGRDMYPSGFRTAVEVEGLSAVFEGASRPGFFRGVCTVVLKLFQIVAPHFSVFGQKDAQQALIVRRMVADLNLDMELVVEPTVREADGLARSSRNAYLDPEQRRAAGVLYRALEAAKAMIEAEESVAGERVEAEMRRILEAEPLARVDYVAAVEPSSLDRLETVEDEVLLLVAAWIGQTRLIDNLLLPEIPGVGGGDLR
ncbi:MAG: pantoate--beta-alanine ligase [Acidobacteriota bacterium]|nr:pantoate--beta-alanine ligase [Acidobacteriota bacterium]MDQ7088208.1 pantoate--beta-alanine ligase [Acidobacteriota bacterium]